MYSSHIISWSLIFNTMFSSSFASMFNFCFRPVPINSLRPWKSCTLCKFSYLVHFSISMSFLVCWHLYLIFFCNSLFFYLLVFFSLLFSSISTKFQVLLTGFYKTQFNIALYTKLSAFLTSTIIFAWGRLWSDLGMYWHFSLHSLISCWRENCRFDFGFYFLRCLLMISMCTGDVLLISKMFYLLP